MTSRLSILLLVAALALYAALGTFVRLEADDACELVMTRLHGALGFPVRMYELWSGRATLFGVKGVLYSLFGETVPALAPLLILTALVGATAYALAPRLGRRAWLAGLSLTLALVLALSNPYQTLYWASASLMVLLPVAFTLVLAGLLARRAHPLLIGVVALLSGGFNEPHATIQVVVFGMWWLATRTRYTTGALIGVTVSLTLTMLAPGNAVRAAVSSSSLYWGEILFQNLVEYVRRVPGVLVSAPLVAALPFAAGWWLRPFRARHAALLSLVLVLGALLLGAASVLLLTAARMYSDPRHDVVALALLLGAAFAIGSLTARGTLTSAPLVTCAALALVAALAWTGGNVPRFMLYASQRDVGQPSTLLASAGQFTPETAAFVRGCNAVLDDLRLAVPNTYPPVDVAAFES